MNIHVPALQRRLSDVVAEYDLKLAAIDQALADFNAAGDALKAASTVGGTWGNVSIDTGHVYDSTLKTSLLKSAWRHVYDGLNIAAISSADDRRKWERAIESPAPFTLDNIRGTFGKFITDPRANILRGLAETFCGLDPFYKSHERVKIGVEGLPKRVVISSVGYWSSYGMERLRDLFNALAAYRGEPLIDHQDFAPLDRLSSWTAPRAGEVVIRGVTIKKFKNGNAHVIFDRVTLLDINRALAEYYGDVLPDAAGEKPDQRRPGTEVSKDLQFYRTSVKVADDLVSGIYGVDGAKTLEPSCGDGALLDALRKAGAKCLGIEVDPSRAALARLKGHSVVVGNFLEQPPSPEFDFVVMNPPFYGRHYEKHVRHALKFLKPGGKLVAILPATARYDHKLLDDLNGRWDDLPVGSFSESGTNINTTVLRVHKDGTKFY